MTTIVSVADFSTDSNTFTLTKGSAPTGVDAAGNDYIDSSTMVGGL